MPKLSKKGLKKRKEFLIDSVREYGFEKVNEWMNDKGKRNLVNALCEVTAND